MRQDRMHQDRTYAVTGAASGIGAATAQRLREGGARVIACDLHDADVIADLTTADGRTALAEGVARLCGGRLDGVVANAGGGMPDVHLALNFFGAVATLEGLRPLLGQSPAPRAVATSSIACLRTPDPKVLDACLAMDESAAVAAGREAFTLEDPLALYGAAKLALNNWCRRTAIEPSWGGAGIPLNVVALGFVDTPAAALILSDPDLRAQGAAMVPLAGVFPGRPEQAAAALAWCVGAENSMMTGQVLFVDGGAERRALGAQ